MAVSTVHGLRLARRPRKIRGPLVRRLRDRTRVRRRDGTVDYARARGDRGRLIVPRLVGSTPTDRGVVRAPAVDLTVRAPDGRALAGSGRGRSTGSAMLRIPGGSSADTRTCGIGASRFPP